MMLSYRKIDGQVVMLGRIENSALSFVELPDDPRMSQGYSMKIKDGIIEYEKPVWMQKQEKKDKLVDEISKAKDLNDLKTLLLKII